MERRSVDETTAFNMLRTHARDANRKLLDVGRGRRRWPPPIAKQPMA
jgi:hypothetical protein